VQVSEQVAQTDLDNMARCVARLIQESPDLQSVIEAWPNLPEAVRSGIAAMVQAARRWYSSYVDHDRTGHRILNAPDPAPAGWLLNADISGAFRVH